MSARRDAPLMPGDRVVTADRRRGFAVAPAPEDRWRILFDDHTFDLVPRRELRREIMAELEDHKTTTVDEDAAYKRWRSHLQAIRTNKRGAA